MADFLYFYILNLLPGFLVLSLGFFAFSKNPREPLNRLFLGFTFLSAASGVVGVFYRTATNVTEAANWDIFYSTAFYSSIGAFLHFCLVFYFRKGLNFFRFWIFIYPPIFAVLLLEHFSDLINRTFTRGHFGYFQAVAGPLDIYRYLFLVAYIITGIFFLYKSYRESTDQAVKKQAQMIIWGVILPLVIGSVTDQLLPYFNIRYGSFVMFSLFFMSFFLFIAITRYRFAQITPELAVESTVSCIPDPLLVSDNAGNIAYCNNFAMELFKSPLVNENLSLFAERTDMEGLIRSLSARGVDSEKMELDLRSQDGTVFSAELSCSTIKSADGESLGLLWTIRDLSDDIKLKNDLVKKSTEIGEKIGELERMNKFMAGRDARLEELRSELISLGKDIG